MMGRQDGAGAAKENVMWRRGPKFGNGRGCVAYPGETGAGRGDHGAFRTPGLAGGLVGHPYAEPLADENTRQA